MARQNFQIPFTASTEIKIHKLPKPEQKAASIPTPQVILRDPSNSQANEWSTREKQACWTSPCPHQARFHQWVVPRGCSPCLQEGWPPTQTVQHHPQRVGLPEQLPTLECCPSPPLPKGNTNASITCYRVNRVF